MTGILYFGKPQGDHRFSTQIAYYVIWAQLLGTLYYPDTCCTCGPLGKQRPQSISRKFCGSPYLLLQYYPKARPTKYRRKLLLSAQYCLYTRPGQAVNIDLLRFHSFLALKGHETI